MGYVGLLVVLALMGAALYGILGERGLDTNEDVPGVVSDEKTPIVDILDEAENAKAILENVPKI